LSKLADHGRHISQSLAHGGDGSGQDVWEVRTAPSNGEDTQLALS